MIGDLIEVEIKNTCGWVIVEVGVSTVILGYFVYK